MKFLLMLPVLVATIACVQSDPGKGSRAIPTTVIGSPDGSGAWPAIAEGRSDASGYTIYRPDRWPEGRLPLILWGNGGCKNNGLSASHFLREVASHGYFVIANGAPSQERPVLSALPLPNKHPMPPPPAVHDETTVEQLLAAIDWASGAGIPEDYAGHIDTSRVAVMGHSCGGLQALAAGTDPRIATVIAFNSGVYNRPGSGLSGVHITKDDLLKLHTPVAYFLGGPSDIAYQNGSDDVRRIAHVPVFYGNLPVGHGGTFALANGGAWGRVAVAWLNWQMKQDKQAGLMFVGKNCGLCKAKDWTIIRKQFPVYP